MNIIHTEAYRTGFAEYLRKGTPIRLSAKGLRTTERYVWRTRGDANVRLSHRRNEGRIFEWANPSATGHPGEEYNCRCEAVPYIEGLTEYAYHDITTSLDSPNERWSGLIDFAYHYYTGEGQPVTLREIGHLREVVEQFAFKDKAEGAFRRWSNQIASKARREEPGAFTHDFENFYDFGDVAYSHGDGTVKGLFIGIAEDRGAMLAIHGETTFTFSDKFIIDPLEIGVDLGLGMPFPITGTWTANFFAEVFKSEGRSDFVYKGNF